MKRIFTLFSSLLIAGLIHLSAEVKDAATVYAEFAHWVEVIKEADPQSAEYEQAAQEMLLLFPQLNYHAAKFSQQKQLGNAMSFAKAYVDLAMMPQFEAMHLENSEVYPTMTYFLASNYYNRKDYNNAVTYLNRYIQLNEPKNRAVVYLFLAKSYEHLGDFAQEMAVLDNALTEFPNTLDLLTMSINVRMENGWYDDAMPLIEKALEVTNGDTRLVALKGQCLEAQQKYEEAADVYEELAEKIKTLSTYKHYALNLYNCAVLYYPTDKELALSYIRKAIPYLEKVVANDSTSLLYTNALGMSYLYTDNYKDLASVNRQLKTMGQKEIGRDLVEQQQLLVSESQHAASSSSQKQNSDEAKTHATPKTSDYRVFVQNYVDKEVKIWQAKDPFETIDEYKERVTEQTRNDKVVALMEEAKRRYLEQYEKKISREDFELMPYDAENKVFLIRSNYGDVVLPVPRENNEARNFAKNWDKVLITTPVCDIAGKNDEIIIRSIEFVTSDGKSYRYSNNDEATYLMTEIAMQFDNIDYSQFEKNANQKNNVKIEKSNVVVGNSDVDINIPVAKNAHTNTFAFLIGNEHYQQLASVPFALHDARIMKQYFQKTLGIPESNIRVYEDATFGKFLSCMREIRNIADAYNGDVDLIFYYAGHGVPDEASKSAYLLPIDADATQTETCFPVGRLYHELGHLGVNSVIIFMDACFSGSQRGEGMLASARGVALKAKEDVPQGRMVTITAATGDETAYPYEEQQHGMFTYYLLKCMQDNRGRMTLGELADYVQTQVKQRSVVINHKNQTPTVNASPEAKDWRKWNWK